MSIGRIVFKGKQMLKRDDVLSAIKAGRESECLDRRDYLRLCLFFPVSDWEALGFEAKEDVNRVEMDWTPENIIAQLKSDVEFGFEKALNRRSLSADSMFNTVNMWLWILEDDEVADHEGKRYKWYGLPLFKAVAEKYGFENRIGSDSGDEKKYSNKQY